MKSEHDPMIHVGALEIRLLGDDDQEYTSPAPGEVAMRPTLAPFLPFGKPAPCGSVRLGTVRSTLTRDVTLSAGDPTWWDQVASAAAATAERIRALYSSSNGAPEQALEETGSTPGPWYAMRDDTIGGWCVRTTPDPPSSDKGRYVASFVTEEDARFIAEAREKSGMCVCVTSGPDVDGPSVECPVHGAIHDYNRAMVEVDQVREQVRRLTNERDGARKLLVDVRRRVIGMRDDPERWREVERTRALEEVLRELQAMGTHRYQSPEPGTRWCDDVPPGGYVCAFVDEHGRECGVPVESEPCRRHDEDELDPVPKPVGLFDDVADEVVSVLRNAARPDSGESTPAEVAHFGSEQPSEQPECAAPPMRGDQR